MKFKFNGVIWDAENNKALCESENGYFETEEEITINKLLALGYTAETVEPETVETAEPVKKLGKKK